MSELITSLQTVPVAEVETGTRLRPVSEAGVEAILASITELGVMKDAIHVRKTKTGLVLIAGGHRLEAARRLGWDEVPAKVWRCSKRWAQLMEVDDNLASAELNALDTAVFLAERKRLYEELHPETKAGVAGGLARHGLATDTVSFAKTTAEKFGLSARHVERLVAAGAILSKDEVRWLRSAPRPVSVRDLQALSRMEDTHERSQVCIALSNGTAKTASQAQGVVRGGDEEAVQHPTDAQFNALRSAWSRACVAARARFVEAHEADLAAYLSGGATE